ncbi:MAG: sugar phosphate nucleotidyltransferase, partial [Acidimicrobiales bacterium]
MKGVLLAGGTGSRLYPLTRITNKHLLPIGDRPMISYGIEALVQAGITEIMVVTGGTHAGEFLRLLSNGREHGLDLLVYGYQDRPGGIAEALGLAEHFVGGDSVCVMLADNIVERSIRPSIERFAEQSSGARLLLAEISDPAHLRHLGVPELDGEGRLTRIVEKPTDPPSNYCVTGIYLYDSSVFEVIGADRCRQRRQPVGIQRHFRHYGSQRQHVQLHDLDHAGRQRNQRHGQARRHQLQR